MIQYEPSEKDDDVFYCLFEYVDQAKEYAIYHNLQLVNIKNKSPRSPYAAEGYYRKDSSVKWKYGYR